MLSYQHAYHAGNLADIHKHGALCVLLQRMREKPKPFTYMETHAGRGLYDVAAKESRKTGEAQAGIIKFLAAGVPPKSHPYRRVIDRVRDKYGATAYPGSPLIARALLNPDDPMYLMELHPAEFEGLRHTMQGSGAHLHKRDGFEAVLELAPPPPGHPRRGLVFIDPSFEIKSEYRYCAEFVLALHAKWPEAVIVLWYPVLEPGLHKAMVETLKNADIAKLAIRETPFQDADKTANHRILGSGLAIINQPFGTDKGLDQVEGWFGG